jgi:hypothetical protein
VCLLHNAAKIDRLQTRASFARAAEREKVVEKLKAAWIAFDGRWNGYRPTDAQMARWMTAIGI